MSACAAARRTCTESFRSRCWVQVINDYTELAERYLTQFDRKWLRTDSDQSERRLGSRDIESLANAANGVRIVRDKQMVPALLRPLSGL